MASYRTVGFQPVGSPLLATEQDNSIKQLADIFYSGMSAAGQIAGIAGQANNLKANAINMETQQFEYEKKIEEAEKDAIDDLILQGFQIKQEAAQNELNELEATTQSQTENIPQMLAENAGDLRAVMRNNPGLTGPVRRSIQREIVKNEAQQDLADLDVLVAQNPQKSTEELFGSFLQDKNKLGRFQDPYERGLWQQVLNEEFNKVSAVRTVQFAQQELKNGLDAADANVKASVNLVLPFMNTNSRDNLLSEYTDSVLSFDISRSPTQLEQNFVIATGESFKLLSQQNPMLALQKFDEIYPEGDELYKKNNQYLTAVKSELVQNANTFQETNKKSIASGTKSAIESATTVEQLNFILANIPNVLDAEEKKGLQLFAQKKVEDEFAKRDDVANARMGKNVVINSSHDKEIDKALDIEVRSGIPVSDALPSIAYRTRITDAMADSLNLLAITNPSEAAKTLANLEFVRPEMVNELINNKKINARTRTYLQMNKNFGYAIEDVAAELEGVTDGIYDDANATYQESKVPTKDILTKGLDGWSFGDKPDWITSRFSTFYRDAYLFSYAKASKDYPGTNKADLAVIATHKATDIVKKNYTMVKLNGENIPAKSTDVPLPVSEFEAMNSFYVTAVSGLEAKDGNLSRGDLKPDLYNIRKEADGSIVIPILNPNGFTGGKSYAEIVLPAKEEDRAVLFKKFRTQPDANIENRKDKGRLDVINNLMMFNSNREEVAALLKEANEIQDRLDAAKASPVKKYNDDKKNEIKTRVRTPNARK